MREGEFDLSLLQQAMALWGAKFCCGPLGVPSTRDFKVAHVFEVEPIANNGMTCGACKGRQFLVIRVINYA